MLALGLVAVALLAGCGGGGDAKVTVYSNEFTVGRAAGWLTQRADRPADCAPVRVAADPGGDGHAVSAAPWWLDPNHAAPGLGFLHLVAFAYHSDWSIDGEIPGLAPGQPLDLRDADIVVRWRAPTLQMPSSARLLFWFQARDPASPLTRPRYVNYALTGQPLQPLAGRSDWQQATLRLTAAPGQFECLGSNVDRLDTYGCSSDLPLTLATWNVNLGFIILFDDAEVSDRIQGAAEFDRVAIRIPAERLTDAVPLPGSTALGRPSTCRSLTTSIDPTTP